MKAIAILLLSTFVVGILFTSHAVNSHTEKTTINVVDKERIAKTVNDGNGGITTTIENYVYSDQETYEVSDNVWLWHFTSGTVYAEIEKGSTCEVTLSGYRVGFLSWRQNIIAAECVK